MDVTKPYKFIGFGAMDLTKHYRFIGFGAMDVTKPYKFIGFGAIGFHFLSIGGRLSAKVGGRAGNPQKLRDPAPT